MEASKALGIAGFIYIAALALLAIFAYETNFLMFKDFIDKSAVEVGQKFFMLLAIAVAFLFLAIPGLILIWMSEVGQELERNSNSVNETNEAINELRGEIRQFNSVIEHSKDLGK